jgi:hypothetical protein
VVVDVVVVGGVVVDVVVVAHGLLVGGVVVDEEVVAPGLGFRPRLPDAAFSLTTVSMTTVAG